MSIASLTSQFPHCGNSFRVDLYKYCSFGCSYCFAQNRGGNLDKNKQEFEIKNHDIQHLRDTNGFIGSLLKRKVPLHCGGMSDPFQHKEFDMGRTYELIKIMNDYPIMFSTKTSCLPDEYWRVLNPEYHVFQLSITGFPNDAIRDFEANTPTTSERMEFAKKLKRKGFSVFIRIQPLVKYEWAEYLINELGFVVDGFTIEHIKFPLDNAGSMRVMLGMFVKHGILLRLKTTEREYEVEAATKEFNINRLKSIKRTAVINVGDNDLRLLSETVNCCGLDKCPPSFSNWLKLNSMTVKMTGNWEEWQPVGNCAGYLNSDQRIPNYTYKDYVLKHYESTYGSKEQLALL